MKLIILLGHDSIKLISLNAVIRVEVEREFINSIKGRKRSSPKKLYSFHNYEKDNAMKTTNTEQKKQDEGQKRKKKQD